MAWKCPQCGVEGLADASTSHAVENGGCGYARVAAGVALVSEATGKEVSIRLPTTLGNAALKSLDPSEIRFVSSEQFRIERSPDTGSWLLRAIGYATNPTYLNGAPVPIEGMSLKTGDRISIKDKYFHLAVRLLN